MNLQSSNRIGNSDKGDTVFFSILIPQIRHGWLLLISILLIRGNIIMGHMDMYYVKVYMGHINRY